MDDACYLSNQALANDQASREIFHNGGVGNDVEIEWSDFDSDDNIWLVFEGILPSLGQPVTIELVMKDAAGLVHLVCESVTVDLRHSLDFFRTDTALGNQASSSYDTERLEDSGVIRTATIDKYPIAFIESGQLEGNQDVLIYVHGYNNNSEFASVSFQSVYKRLYRMRGGGYRGDMIGYQMAGRSVSGCTYCPV